MKKSTTCSWRQVIYKWLMVHSYVGLPKASPSGIWISDLWPCPKMSQDVPADPITAGRIVSPDSPNGPKGLGPNGSKSSLISSHVELHIWNKHVMKLSNVTLQRPTCSILMFGGWIGSSIMYIGINHSSQFGLVGVTTEVVVTFSSAMIKPARFEKRTLRLLPTLREVRR